MHTLPNISRSKGNQTMKFDQFIEYNLRTTIIYWTWGANHLFFLHLKLQKIKGHELVPHFLHDHYLHLFLEWPDRYQCHLTWNSWHFCNYFSFSVKHITHTSVKQNLSLISSMPDVVKGDNSNQWNLIDIDWHCIYFILSCFFI